MTRASKLEGHQHLTTLV